jgi:6,7-dimethyl-8-ribityllumazine synthase
VKKVPPRIEIDTKNGGQQRAAVKGVLGTPSTEIVMKRQRSRAKGRGQQRAAVKGVLGTPSTEIVMKRQRSRAKDRGQQRAAVKGIPPCIAEQGSDTLTVACS